ncbi:hypothetical protein [Ruegeria arenilitoris]|uniref:hypothetical protein n=1 Tax=Ruegeria arenilitoris TaxID=1173585 RepID=UPI00147AAA73|nr:hypothetical protein [Ruegeria arenilitoris]
MRTTIPIAITMLAASTMISVAETNHDTSSKKHKMHMHAQMHGGTGLKEPGQGAFAALSEVVRVLEVDPETDWSKIDLSGLREHLVDMDLLITGSVVDETVLPDGLRAFATGDADTLASLKRMVPAHAGQLARDDRWTVSVQESDEGVELTVTSEDDAVVARIKGLGFFGLMASQDHHREHHLMMARGEDAHAH